jgi:phenylalanyl-tRNA synthetase alpha chain
MKYLHPDIETAARTLRVRLAELSDKTAVLRAPELKSLYDQIRIIAPDQRATFGRELNALKAELTAAVAAAHDETVILPPLDVTAPMDVNQPMPGLLMAEQGSTHPLMQEIDAVIDLFGRMGFTAEESREIDDQYHMFESVNFPKGHPARDEWDTFMTVQTDQDSDPYIAPAHTSTMQNRVLRQYAGQLQQGNPIAAIVPDRCFRNEDLDARHEHTFYQVEGVYVDKGVHAGMLVATLQTFLQEYYGQKLDVRVNPFYFPFTEPSFEFCLSCPFCQKQGCGLCSQSGWIELLGCGMIHPNVLTMAGIDATMYTGFAFGCGIDRLVMMKYGIEDIRHFESAKLDFLKQF